jgi:hypothetical protein
MRRLSFEPVKNAYAACCKYVPYGQSGRCGPVENLTKHTRPSRELRARTGERSTCGNWRTMTEVGVSI